MQEYQNFFGIDIGKFTFVVSIHGEKSTMEYENSLTGISKFWQEFKSKLLNSLVILETTGNYEMPLLLDLCMKGISAHRANTRKVKNFIRSFGNAAKTDSLDAKALAYYGHERHQDLRLFKQPEQKMLNLYALAQRRRDLKEMLVAEKNRKKSPGSNLLQSSYDLMIEALENEIDKTTLQIEKIINEDADLKARKKVLKEIPGIGDKVAQDLLAFFPELGSLTRREVASLCGLAPRANDSGKHKGYRRTGHGREGIKPMLFLSAMAARNSNSKLKTYYEGLIARGKKKMVALTALMRKIIVIANAKIRDYMKNSKQHLA